MPDTDQIDELEAELQALEQKAMMGGTGGGDDEDFEFDADVSQAVDTYATFEEEDWYPLEVKSVKKNKKNAQMLDVEFAIAAGPRKNKKIFDGIMMSGDGAFRFKALGSALDMYNHTTKRVTGSGKAMVGKFLWGFIAYEPARTDRNDPDKKYKPRNRVRFSDPFRPQTFQAWPSDSPVAATGDIVDPFAENEVAEQTEPVEETTQDVVEETQDTEQASDVETTEYIGEDISADETTIPDEGTEVSEETAEDLHPEANELEERDENETPGEDGEVDNSETEESTESETDTELEQALADANETDAEETTEEEIEPVVEPTPVVTKPAPAVKPATTPKSTTPAPVVAKPTKPVPKPAESESLPWNDEGDK